VTDLAILQRLLGELRVTVGPTHVTDGTAKLDRQLAGYNSASKYGPWLVVRDLDQDAACAPELLRGLLPEPAMHIRLRVAVRAVESWLLADGTAISRFLGVAKSRVPADPDVLVDPKGTIVSLARLSRRSEVKQMAPSPRSGRRVGPAYTDQIIHFAATGWRPVEAAKHSPSLSSTIRAIREWVVDGTPVCAEPE